MGERLLDPKGGLGSGSKLSGEFLNGDRAGECYHWILIDWLIGWFKL